MFLILSAAYVGQELSSEFGRIPPSFLPLGNRRLFEHQVRLADKDDEIYLTVPDSFLIQLSDQVLISKLNIKLIRLPDSLSLGQALVAALNLYDGLADTPLKVLFGDTLFATSVPKKEDAFLTSIATASYDWAYVDDNRRSWSAEVGEKLGARNKNVVAGYFCFTKPKTLIRSIIEKNWSFIDGINMYNRTVGLAQVFTDEWLDFGHVNTFYKSKSYFTTQRAFNDLVINNQFIEKASSNELKIKAEANWFRSLPLSLRGYTPQFLGEFELNGRDSYRLEYLHQTALNELFVFGELPSFVWSKILDKCNEFLLDCSKSICSEDAESNGLYELLVTKTSERLIQFSESNAVDLNKIWSLNGTTLTSLNEMFRSTEKSLRRLFDINYCSILHGDFCFSNILFDSRAEKIKTIDPRGLTVNNNMSIYGDIRYDVAKLAHSVVGLYDFIIANRFDLSISDTDLDFNIHHEDKIIGIQKLFFDKIERAFGIEKKEVLGMQIMLFLSMLPLHADDEKRQFALLANAARLFKIMEG